MATELSFYFNNGKHETQGKWLIESVYQRHRLSRMEFERRY